MQNYPILSKPIQSYPNLFKPTETYQNLSQTYPKPILNLSQT